MKNCATCDTPYQPGSNNSKYCSKECKALRKGSRTCEGCGQQFVPTPNSAARFCSTACWYIAPGKRVLQPRDCAFCGKTFQPKDNSRKTCSWECGSAMKRRPPSPADCAYCGKALDPYRKLKQKYCDRSCARRGVSRTRRGQGALPIGSLRPSGRYLKVKVAPGIWDWQHRHVMAEHLERPLSKNETVHHKNGDPHDNQLENLELRVGRHGIHATHAHCATCTCFDH